MCWRVCIHGWENNDSYVMGRGGWSLWPKTCDDIKHFGSVSATLIFVLLSTCSAFICSLLLAGLISMHFSVIFNTMFGLSTSYWMALTTRFLLGAFCGTLGPMRVRTSYRLSISWLHSLVRCWKIRGDIKNSRELDCTTFGSLIDMRLDTF